MSELQRLMDNLGNQLGRSVAVDDPQLCLLAYNPHVRDVDAVRTVSILKRSVTSTVVDYVYEHGADTATDLFTVPACAELGLDIGRIGVPIRHRGSLLGFVWLLASDGPVTDEQAESVRGAAATVAVIMHREYLLGELTRSRERELTRDLLAEQADVRARAADDLITENLFSTEPVAALVVTLSRDEEDLTDPDRLALAAGVEFGRRHRMQHHALTLQRPSHALLLLTTSKRAKRQSSSDFGQEIRRHVLTEADAGANCTVGIGEPRSNLADVYASYREAERAAEVAHIVRLLGPVVHYRDLGVYGMLAELPRSQLLETLHPGLHRLFDRESDNDHALSRTLETFLNNACSVKNTAEQLVIHRATLYYRLKRIEEITGLNLAVGDDRLSLHLGLKIARLIGYGPP